MDQAALRQLLTDLMRERRESLSAFGVTWARTIGPDHKPFSRQHVWRLQNGRDPINEEQAAALHVLAAMLDGVSEAQARAHAEPSSLFVGSTQPGQLVYGDARRCTLPGCRVWFIGPSARRYCSEGCRLEAAKRRKEARKVTRKARM